MNKKEKELFSKILKIASDELSKHCCNDVDENFFNDWSIDERKHFVKDFHKFNGSICEYDENFLQIPDYALVLFLAHKIITE